MHFKGLNTSPFPRVVWALIIEYLSYFDRCQLRRTCKWLAIFKNNEPIEYWFKRGDPIVQLLGEHNLAFYKMKNGITVDPKYFTNDNAKSLFIGGNMENFNNYFDTHHTLYTHIAHRNGHHEIVKKCIDLFHPRADRGNTKYKLMIGDFENINDEICVHSILLKFEVNEKNIKNFEKRLSRRAIITNRIIQAIRKKNIGPLRIYLKNPQNIPPPTFDVLDFDFLKILKRRTTICEFFAKAVKYNFTEAIILLMKYMHIYDLSKIGFDQPIFVFNMLKDDNLILFAAVSYEPENLFKAILDHIIYGKFHAIKRLMGVLKKNN